MKKYFFYVFCPFLFIPVTVSAQNETNSRVSSPDAVLSQRVFKVYNNPDRDKTDQIEIQGLGGVTFTTSNTADGTTNSYKHSPEINLTLIPVKGGTSGTSSIQLIFYSPVENIQQAASSNTGVLSIYYPLSMYDGIKEKLDQSIAAKKKIVVKVTQRTNGYREGSLIF